MASVLRGSDNFDSAGINALRAWVNFNGAGTVAILASGNVSSITDNGAGDWTANFAAALQDSNYSLASSNNWSKTNPSSGYYGITTRINALLTTSARFEVYGATASASPGVDPTVVCITIFR